MRRSNTKLFNQVIINYILENVLIEGVENPTIEQAANAIVEDFNCTCCKNDLKYYKFYNEVFKERYLPALPIVLSLDNQFCKDDDTARKVLQKAFDQTDAEAARYDNDECINFLFDKIFYIVNKYRSIEFDLN